MKVTDSITIKANPTTDPKTTNLYIRANNRSDADDLTTLFGKRPLASGGFYHFAVDVSAESVETTIEKIKAIF